MKFLILFSMLAQFAIAANLNANDQKKLVDNVAKQVRRDLYVNRYSNVETSAPQFFTRTELNEFYQENMGDFKRNRSVVSQFYKCVNSKTCSLWMFTSYSSMYGGSGSTFHFVLINLNTGRYNLIDVDGYEE